MVLVARIRTYLTTSPCLLVLLYAHLAICTLYKIISCLIYIRAVSSNILASHYGCYGLAYLVR